MYLFNPMGIIPSTAYCCIKLPTSSYFARRGSKLILQINDQRVKFTVRSEGLAVYNLLDPKLTLVYSNCYGDPEFMEKLNKLMKIFLAPSLLIVGGTSREGPIIQYVEDGRWHLANKIFGVKPPALHKTDGFKEHCARWYKLESN